MTPEEELKRLLMGAGRALGRTAVKAGLSGLKSVVKDVNVATTEFERRLRKTGEKIQERIASIDKPGDDE